MDDNKPRRCAVIVYFDLPDNRNPAEIRNWIKAKLLEKELSVLGDIWDGKFHKANLHIDLINTGN